MSLFLSAQTLVRFHHVHSHVEDQAAAMNDAASLLKGTRVIVQGLGVGVRTGSEFVLFDREAADETPPRKPTGAATLYAEAVEWLRARDVAVTPASLAESAVAPAVSGRAVDHIAFAVDDLDGLVAVLTRKGIAPQSQTASSVFFALPSGGRIEIVRSTDRPEAFWCPMHPDVRSADAGKCALCGMDLTAIPPPRVGEYKMDVTLDAGRLHLVIRDPTGTDAVRQFAEVHERPFHLFIVSRDLAFFAHEHPRQLDSGAFELRTTLPPDEYMLIADFLPHGGTPQTLQRAIVTPGHRGSVLEPARLLDIDVADKVVDGMRVRLDAVELAPRRAATLRVTVTDASTGAGVADLEPYLGAAGHMLVVNADLTEAIHAHPEERSTGGPSIAFDPVLPAAGRYKLWVQFQRRGKIYTVPFVVAVSDVGGNWL